MRSPKIPRKEGKNTQRSKQFLAREQCKEKKNEERKIRAGLPHALLFMNISPIDAQKKPFRPFRGNLGRSGMHRLGHSAQFREPCLTPMKSFSEGSDISVSSKGSPPKVFRAFNAFWKVPLLPIKPDPFWRIFDAFFAHFSHAFVLLPTPFPRTPFGQHRTLPHTAIWGVRGLNLIPRQLVRAFMSTTWGVEVGLERF